MASGAVPAPPLAVYCNFMCIIACVPKHCMMKEGRGIRSSSSSPTCILSHFYVHNMHAGLKKDMPLHAMMIYSIEEIFPPPDTLPSDRLIAIDELASVPLHSLLLFLEKCHWVYFKSKSLLCFDSQCVE